MARLFTRCICAAFVTECAFPNISLTFKEIFYAGGEVVLMGIGAMRTNGTPTWLNTRHGSSCNEGTLSKLKILLCSSHHPQVALNIHIPAPIRVPFIQILHQVTKIYHSGLTLIQENHIEPSHCHRSFCHQFLYFVLFCQACSIATNLGCDWELVELYRPWSSDTSFSARSMLLQKLITTSIPAAANALLTVAPSPAEPAVMRATSASAWTFETCYLALQELL
jgi:hypothetical protein